MCTSSTAMSAVKDSATSPSCWHTWHPFMARAEHKAPSQARGSQLPLHCHNCKRTFSTKGALKTHVQTIHQHLFPFHCSVCAKGCVSKLHLKGHMSTHTKAHEHHCTLCGRGFGYKSSLVSHMANMHASAQQRHGPSSVLTHQHTQLEQQP